MGKVYLVGAGLGDRSMVTSRALEVVQQADVVLIDDLVDPHLWAEIPGKAVVIRVGKRVGQETISQDQINQVLIQLAQSHQQVVRLKAGDPWIFGRVLQEIQALQTARCSFEVIPGISSALGGPLFAGIPLTDPQRSRCFAVLTAHDLEALPWEALAQLETLVILMGSQKLEGVMERLMAVGRSAETPAAFIRHAGGSQQQVWTGSLATLSQQISTQSRSPGIIVVGEVVRLRDQILPWGSESWRPDPRPLAGKTVLVTRADTQATTLTDLLKLQGARVIEMPTLEIVPPSSWDPLDQAIEKRSEFAWVILTSANAVTYFFDRLHHQGLDSRCLHCLKIAVVGSKTATVLGQYGIRPDLMPTEFVADALLDAFPGASDLVGQKILFPRVETGGREVLVKGLQDLGATVVEVAAYQSICPPYTDPPVIQALRWGQVDVVTFASSKTVQHFCYLLQQADLDLDVLQPSKIAAIGPKTAETCQSYFGRMDIMPAQYTLEDLVQAIVSASTSEAW